jgi:putative membrane protein
MFGWGWLGAILGLIILLLIIAVLGALLAFLIRTLRRPSQDPARSTAGPGSATQALQILEERYARGEIDQEDYEQRRRVLLER